MKTNRFLAFLLSALMLPVAALAQQADPVIMTINGKPVTKSEFVYSYKKNNGDNVIDRKSVEDYVQLFINYRLKVEAAMDAKLDTLTSYKKEFHQYRNQQITPTFVSDADMEKESHVIYDETKNRIGIDGYINPWHILVRVPQNAEESAKNAALNRADSIYNALKNGADFAATAKKTSEDVGSAPRGGDIGWIGRNQTLKSFEDAAFALKDNEISKPVLSEVGYHIIMMKGHKDFEPYDSLKRQIYAFMERRGVRNSIAQERLKSYCEATGKSAEAVMDERADSLAALSEDMKYLIKEYHDGLLMFEISNREVWEKAAKDENGLKATFKKNKKKYAWDEPRYKGIAYYTRDIADVEAVKKSLKGKDFGNWAKILRSTFNNDSILRIRVEKGIFKKGDNTLIDKYGFNIADVKVKTVKDFPNEAIFGKMIKAPEEMSDARTMVLSDYQEELEKEWIKRLRARYPVVVNKEIVATVEE